jgi:hypothetical protein
LPAVVRYCVDAFVLRDKPPSTLVRFLLPVVIGVAALALLGVARRRADAARWILFVAAGMVVAGTIVALVLPAGTAPDPLICGSISHGLRHAGDTVCNTAGGHVDHRLALRYLVLLGALVSAGLLLIDVPRRRADGSESFRIATSE